MVPDELLEQQWSDRRHFIEGSDVSRAPTVRSIEEEEEEEQPFDCAGDNDYEYYDDEDDEMIEQGFEVDEQLAVERARRYSPWEANKGNATTTTATTATATVASPARRATIAVASSPSSISPPSSKPTSFPRRASSPRSSPTSTSTSTGTPGRSRSKPWRVDVMLKKGKGVERSTSSWKQQMKERKQVFALSGVTVPESMEDEPDVFPDVESKASHDSIFAGLEGDEMSKGGHSDDTASEGAVIGSRGGGAAGISSAGTITATRAAEPIPVPGIIDLTNVVEEPPLISNHSKTNMAADHQVFGRDADMSMLSMDSTPPRETSLNGSKHCPPQRILQMQEEESSKPSSPREDEDEDEVEMDRRKSSAIAEISSTLNQALQEDDSILHPTPAGQQQQQQQQQHVVDGKSDKISPTSAVIADMRATQKQVENHCETSFERRNYYDDDDDDDDDMHSVTSIRSLCSTAFFPSSPTRKEETRIQANRRSLIHSLEATFSHYNHADHDAHYSVTAFGRAGLDPPKYPKNEYFTAYARMQRSRFIRELSSTVSLLSTRHFHVVEQGKEDQQQQPQPPNNEESSSSHVEMFLPLQDDKEEYDIKFISPINTDSMHSTDDDDDVEDYENVDDQKAIVLSIKPHESLASPMNTSAINAYGLLAALNFGGERPAEQTVTPKEEEEEEQEQPVPVVDEESSDAQAVPELPISSMESSSNTPVAETPKEEEEQPVPAVDEESSDAQAVLEMPISSMEPPSTEAAAATAIKDLQHSDHSTATTDIKETPVETALHETLDDNNEAPQTTEAQMPTPTNESIPTAVDGDDQAQPGCTEPAETSERMALDAEATQMAATSESATATTDGDNHQAQSGGTEPSETFQVALDVEATQTTATSESAATTVNGDDHKDQQGGVTIPPPTSTDESNSEEPQGKKKSKASKWKDRLAKRKSVSRRDSDISNSSTSSPVVTAESVPAVPASTPQKDPSKPPLPPSEAQSPRVVDTSSPGPLEPCGSPSEENTTKGRRKSQKWKQRLASKRESKSSGDSPVQPERKDREPITISDEKKDDADIPQPTKSVLSTTVEEPPAPPSTGDAKETIALSTDETTTNYTTTSAVEPKETSHVVSELKESAPTPPTPAMLSTTDEKAQTAQAKEPQVMSPLSNVSNAMSNAPETEKVPAVPNDLRNSFMAFDALLQQRQGGADLTIDGDDYSEYTIEESVLNVASPSNAAFLPKGTEKAETTNKSIDNEYQYEEITVELSFMELTVEETVDNSNMSSPEENPTTTPMHQATVNMMSSRMFNTPQVSQEPTITVQHLSDDEMTQLTFDQSYVEPSAQKPPQAPPSSIEKKPPLDPSVKTSSKATFNGSMHGSRSGSAHGSRSGSAHGSRKHGSSVAGSQRSHRSSTSKGGASTSSESNNKRVADLLRKDIWSKDAKVVEEAMETIVNEASRSTKHRAKIVQCGGIMGIVRAMEAHADIVPVQVNACAALDRMAMDPETQVVISEMGGITAILDAMKTFEADEDVHQASCSALANITRHRGTTDEAEGAVQVLCASMTRHSSNMVVQARAFGAISNLCMDNQLRLKELSDAGGMLAMTMALQQPWPSKTEKHEAISNLSILLRCLAEHEEGGGTHDEEYEESQNQEDMDEDFMSVVSGLDDGSSEGEGGSTAEQPTPGKEGVLGNDDEAVRTVVDQMIDHAESAGPESPLPEGKYPVKDEKTRSVGLEQGSNSTQPTESTSREIDDENCVIS